MILPKIALIRIGEHVLDGQPLTEIFYVASTPGDLYRLTLDGPDAVIAVAEAEDPSNAFVAAVSPPNIPIFVNAACIDRIDYNAEAHPVTSIHLRPPYYYRVPGGIVDQVYSPLSDEQIKTAARRSYMKRGVPETSWPEFLIR